MQVFRTVISWENGEPKISWSRNLRLRRRRHALLHLPLRAEEVAMGAKMGADQFQTVFDDSVDKHKVGFDMAIAKPDVVAFERVVIE